MHHNDAGYDVHDPMLSARQREIVEFPPVFYNERRGPDGAVMTENRSKDTGRFTRAPLRHAEVQTVRGWREDWRRAARL
jgi:hypothetical protein